MAGHGRKVRQVARPVEPTTPSFLWSYETIVPADGVPHPLNELGFGYFTAADPVNSDRAIKSIQIHNPLNQLPGGASLFLGSGGIIPVFCTEEILPGEREQFAVDHLSAISLANYDIIDIIAVITFVADRV